MMTLEEEIEDNRIILGLLDEVRQDVTHGPAETDVNFRISCRALRKSYEDRETKDYQPYATDFMTAMSLIPEGSWFNYNHFGFSIVPNKSIHGGVMHNAMDYEENGNPLRYEAMLFDSPQARLNLPARICYAVYLTYQAECLKSLAFKNGRMYLVQTGRGPRIATPEGKLIEIKYDQYFTADGQLVEYDEKIHGTGRVECPDQYYR